jgi:hypothetical protein
MTFTVPAGMPAGSTLWLPFTGTFTYNGTGNLIVDVDVAGASADTPWAFTDIGVAQSLYGASGSSVGATYVASLHTNFRFNGGTMDVNPISMGLFGDSFPFSISSGARQWLYFASELGTSGSISKLECRNYGFALISTAQSYTYKIVMSHLAVSSPTLSTTRATNLPSPVTVVDGAVNMPAGLIAGDYFSIPLSTTFSYNGTDNLVIDISGTGTASGFACALSQDAVYTNRRTFGASAATTFAYATGLPAMRFTISK